MNWWNIFRRPKASIVPLLLVCSAISSQHGFLQFYIVKVFIADYRIPSVPLIHGALWEILFRFLLSVIGVVISMTFDKTTLASLKSSKWLILLSIFSSLGFLIPWHREISNVTSFTFHFSLSLIVSELSTTIVASYVTDGLSRLFKAVYDPHTLLMITEATITISLIIIPITQAVTQNFENFLIFQSITYALTAFSFLALIIGSIFWPKKDKKLVPNEVAKIPKKFSVRFTKAVKDKIKISVVRSARGTGGSGSVIPIQETSTNTADNVERGAPASNHSIFSLLRSPHFLFPLLGRMFRQSRIVVNCTMLYFIVEVLFVQAESISPIGIGIPIIYFLSLSLHTVVFYFVLPAFKDAGPVVINHLLALVSIINLTALLIFGRNQSFIFAIFLIMENTLSRCSCSMIYGMFESFLFESLKKHNTSRQITAKQLHFFASILPNAVETASLILVISVIHISGFQKYMSIEGYHRDKCDPIPHRPPGVLNRLMGHSWRVSEGFQLDTRIDNLQLNGTVSDFPLKFFACEGLVEIIYLFGSLYPLICSIGEFVVMYLYRKQFKLENGRIVPN